MQVWDKGGAQDYENYLQHEFSSAAADAGDEAICKPLLADMVNRQEILFMQFQMAKKGKSLGLQQWRILRLEEGKLIQSDGREDKQLPLPSSIQVTRRIDDDKQWTNREASFEAKILLFFKQRNEVIVYFRSIVQCREIAMFLLAQMRKTEKKGFDRLANHFKAHIIQAVASKIQGIRRQGRAFGNARMRAKVGEACRRALTDQALITNFLQVWRSKAYFRTSPLSLGVKLRQITLPIERFSGVVKIWAQGRVNKQVSVVQDNTSILSNAGKSIIKLSDAFTADFEEIGAEDQIQIQVQTGSVIWKTERFTACDAWRVGVTQRNIQLSLTGKGEQGRLWITLLFPSLIQKPTVRITPHHYRIIDELYNPSGVGFELQNIHQHFVGLIQQARLEERVRVSWNKGRQLLQALKGEQILDKFYSVEPFKAATNVTHRATYVYDYFLRDYGRELYYDIEKLMWRHPNSALRRILTALKVFDQNLKFIFTDGLYFLVDNLYGMAQRESIGRWKEVLFERSLKGVESFAFLMAVCFLKLFPGVLVHQQVSRRALPLNSLLFLLVLRTKAGKLGDKLAVLELNIQALFGIHFTSLLTSLFRQDILARFLLLLVEEKRQQPQTLLLPTLIATFLAAIQMTDQLDCAYASAEQYMIAFEQKCRNPTEYFWSRIEQWRKCVLQVSGSAQWNALSGQVSEFYQQNSYGGQLGEVAQQIYQQFTCYHYKDQNELRKLLIMIDRIEVGAQAPIPALTIAIFQAGLKLYEHQFKGVSLSQLRHFIQLRLLRLQELTIVCSTEKECFLSRLDPKELPSNLYFHICRPLLASRPLPEANRHILFQAYIKDSCEVDSLQNPIPEKYRQLILENGVSREEVLFCRKYSRTFRMRQSNFNLLYSKLGWLGGHYLIPHDRLLSLNILTPNAQPSLVSRTAVLNRYTRTLYGKALAPYPSEMIIEGIRTEYEGALPSLRSSISEISTYNSASRLASYALDNFNIGNTHFLQFYYRMAQLPLIDYLSYRPRQFFLLPTFTLQVAMPASVCTVIFSQRGQPFCVFSVEAGRLIEEAAMNYSKLPIEVQLGYADGSMYFDDFLFHLRLNLLKRVIEVGRKEQSRKGRSWGASLACTPLPIPNYRLHSFYEAMNETKQIVQLHFRDQKGITGVKYEDFGLISGRWIAVCTLGICNKNKKNEKLFVVVEEQTRKRHILKQDDLIRTSKVVIRQLKNEQQLTDYFQGRLDDL